MEARLTAKKFQSNIILTGTTGEYPDLLQIKIFAIPFFKNLCNI
jgi:hypothetical protein